MGGQYGVPATITSDQGRQFTSALWTGLHNLLGVQLIKTKAYHPQRNGMVERCHGQLKAALWPWLASTEWPEHLPWVLLGLRTTPKEDSAISSAELMFGTLLSLPAEFIPDAEPSAEHFLARFRGMEMRAPMPLTYAEVAAKPPMALMEASHVHQTWRGHYTSGSIQGGGQAGKISSWRLVAGWRQCQWTG